MKTKKYLLFRFLYLLLCYLLVIDLLSVFININICQRINLGFNHLTDLLVRDYLNLLWVVSFINFCLIPLCSKYDLSLFKKLLTII